MSILVSPAELHDAIHRGDKVTVLATHWGAGENDGQNQFRSLHIPTAQFCDAAGALAGLPGSKNGRNPLPDPDKLQSWFHTWGMREGRRVVVYDEGRGLFAGRTWWMLRWAGIDNVAMLDGGMANWRRQGLPTLTGPGNISVESDATVSPNPDMVATLDEVKEFDGPLIDTREPNRFAGRRENLDLKAGHVPGAVNVAERHLHNADRTWKSKEEIREVFANAGIDESNVKDAIVYSGSGNHSALALAVMEWAGLPGARHFVGGWSQWCGDPKNPVERGDRLTLD
ncbi:sulfurtransferase [Corynebacterium massiliense]|uniref:sulfurtransferase n=1 Tax=Corynebacterium massiliense TaxID=441501 RepID=UPI002353565C|nr:sulfurtransferase [Corynebacterium massiliense]